MTLARWKRLMKELGLAEHRATFDRLRSAYEERGRHYHNVEHIDACLAELDEVRELAKHPAEVELALWFHDAVYSPLSSDNEEKSADWASTFLEEAGLDRKAVERVRELILATRHREAKLKGDSALVVDIDLAILGKDEDTFERFEENVRAEFRWVPSFLYRSKRREILRAFLERDHLYHTAPFRRRYEAPARENLGRVLGKA